MLSFLASQFNFLLLCNLTLAYFNALECCGVPFQLIRVIPKWLLIRMKIRVKKMKCTSAKEITVKYYVLKITYSEIKVKTG